MSKIEIVLYMVVSSVLIALCHGQEGVLFDAGLVDVIKYIPGSRNYGCGLMIGLQYQLYGIKSPISNL
jgi:hypothetical protein